VRVCVCVCVCVCGKMRTHQIMPILAISPAPNEPAASAASMASVKSLGALVDMDSRPHVMLTHPRAVRPSTDAFSSLSSLLVKSLALS
jgi:hypothetical protein